MEPPLKSRVSDVQIVQVGYPFDQVATRCCGHIYQEANPEVTALARRGAA